MQHERKDDGMTEVSRSVTIRRSPAELYARWRDFESLPGIMSNVKTVTEIDGGNLTHWVVEGPLGLDVAWDAQITADERNRRIAWETVGDPDVESSGEVIFNPLPNGTSTELIVRLRYRPMGGAAGKLIAGLFNKDPESELAEDLERFRLAMEGGSVHAGEAL